MLPASTPLLEFWELSFERDDLPLFTGVSAAIRGGDLLQVTGPNGAGKTTLLRILATLLTPATGTLQWRGAALPRARTQYLADLMFLGHAPALKAGLSARENLRWLRGLFALDGDDDAALAAVGLADCPELPCAQLSAGMQRRVALARLPLSRAALWILDEPLTALDPGGIERVEQLLQGHARSGGAVIFSSHQPLDLPGVRELALAP